MKIHRLFVLTSLVIAALTGSSLGLWMLLSWLGWFTPVAFPLVLSAHAQLQVFGFVTLYTQGVAMMVFPSFLRTQLQPAWLAYSCLLLNLVGIASNIGGLPRLGALSLTFSTVAFLAVLRATRKSAPKTRRESTPLSRGHAVFLATGALWLLVSPCLMIFNATAALETVLWGFAGLYIAGIGLRVHPGILGIKGVLGGLLVPSAVVWNLALLARWVGLGTGAFEGLWCWPLTLGVVMFLVALRPFRKPFISAGGGVWLRYFVITSYLWLPVALVMTCLTENGHPGLAGATRHVLATGFILTMMMGMGLRMIPAFETRRIPWKNGPWMVYLLTTAGTLLRIPAQATGHLQFMALGGSLQFLAILSFVVLLVATLLVGEEVRCDEASSAHPFSLSPPTQNLVTVAR